MVDQRFKCFLAAVCLFCLTFGLKGLTFFVVSLLAFALGLFVAVLQRGIHRAAELKQEFSQINACYKATPLNLLVLSQQSKNETKLSGVVIIDALIAEIVDYVLTTYVDSWYRTFTDDQQLLARLKGSSYKTASKIAAGMHQVDWVPFLTRHMIDDFASHIKLFRRSKERLQQKKQRSKDDNDGTELESIFFDLELEMEKNHCRDLVSTSSHYENAYLHDLSNTLLYLLLPPDEFNNKPLFLLLREILVKQVLVTTLDLLSDPDFVNLTVVHLLHDVVIDSEHFLTIIEACNNVEELVAVQEIVEQEISVQRSRDIGGEDDTVIKQELSSLNYVCKLINLRIRRFREGSDSSSLFSHIDSVDLYDLSLGFVLTNSVALSYFMDFLVNVGGQGYIDFYLTIEGFKTSIEHIMSTSTASKKKNANSLSQEDIDTVRVAALGMYNQFLSAEADNRVTLPDACVKKLAVNMHTNGISPLTWFDEVQDKIFEILETDIRFYPSFKRNPLYLKILAELKLSPSINRNDIDGVSQAEDALDSLSVRSLELYESPEKVLSGKVGFASGDEYTLSAQIKTIGIGNENNHPFALYHIFVHKNAAATTEAISWTVTRRYSDFYSLHEYLAKKFNGISAIEFPGKRAFNNLSHDFLERRKRALNSYLKTLLQPQMLRRFNGLEQAVLEFLSQKEYTPDRSALGNKLTSLVNPIRTGVKTISTAMIAVPDTLLDGVVRVGGGLGRVTKTILGGNNIRAKAEFPSPEGRVGALLNDVVTDNIPLRILMLLMDEVFGLRHRNQWFRRQLVVFLQQLMHATFGSSINRKIIDYVRWLTSESQVAEYLKMLRNSICQTDKPSRSSPSLRMRTRVVARLKMLAALPDELRLFIGNETSREGVSLVFEALQNPRLNRRLCYVVLERLLQEMFPKNNFDQILPKLHSKSPRCQMMC